MRADITTQRRLMVEAAESLMGTPYIWWAKGDSIGSLIEGKLIVTPLTFFALDCSGLIGAVLLKVTGKDKRWTWNTDAYWNNLPPIQLPQSGDVALYGGKASNDVSHIELVTKVGPSIEVIGASGGDQRTTSLQIANAQGARVKRHLLHIYRKDFRGFRSMSMLLG